MHKRVAGTAGDNADKSTGGSGQRLRPFDVTSRRFSQASPVPFAKDDREECEVRLADPLNALEGRCEDDILAAYPRSHGQAEGRLPIDECVETLSQPEDADWSVLRRKTIAESFESGT